MLDYLQKVDGGAIQKDEQVNEKENEATEMAFWAVLAKANASLEDIAMRVERGGRVGEESEALSGKSAKCRTDVCKSTLSALKANPAPTTISVHSTSL